MTHLDPETVLSQVRHNMACNLSLKGKFDEESRRQLLDLLSREDMDISDDILRKALDVSEGRIGFVKTTKPVFDYHNPKPALLGYSLHEIRLYAKLWVRYLACKFLLKFLPRVLKFETHTRAFVVADPAGSVLKATPESLQ